MKSLIVLGLMLLPFVAFSQVPDTAMAAKEVDSLIHVCRALTRQGKSDEAHKTINTAKKEALEVFGMKSAIYATCIFNQARIFHVDKKYGDAEALYLEAKNIQEELLGKKHADYASSLTNLGLLYKDERLYNKAEALLLECKDIWGQLTGKDSPEYAMGLNNLAVLYKDEWEYDKAEPLYREAIAIREKTAATNPQEYASSLNNLAVLYADKGEYKKAEQLYLQTKDVREKTLGVEHLDYARGLSNLANLYLNMGEYDKAEPLYLRAKAIRAQKMGTGTLEYATNVNNLAVLYAARGEYGKAEPLYLEAKNIREKKLGTGHPSYAGSLDNLALLYIYRGDYDKAEPLLLDAQSIRAKTLGTAHPDYASGLNNLSLLYRSKQEYDKAEPLYLEAKSIREKTQGKAHPDYASVLNNVAVLYMNKGEYTKAEQMLLEAGSIREKVLGKEHPDYVANLFDLAGVYRDKGDEANARSFFLASNNATKSLLQKYATYSTENEMLRYETWFDERFDALLEFTQHHPSDSLRMAAYDNALFLNNALLFNALALENSISQADSSTRALHAEWKSCHFQLSKQYALAIADRDSAVVARLEEKADGYEKELARRSPGFVTSQQVVAWSGVRDRLKPGEAALEFVHYRCLGKKKGESSDSTKYAALLLRPGDAAPQFIPLFEEREIAPMIKGASGKAFGKINALYSAQQSGGAGQKSLYDLIWKPVEAKLAGVTTLYCSPSGLLHRINLGAIPVSGTNHRETFSNKYRLVLLGSTRRLALSDDQARQGREALLIGGVRYTSDSTAMAALKVSSDGTRGLSGEAQLFRADSTLRGETWNYLAETAIEAFEIQRILRSNHWQTRLDSGYQATEEAFRNLGDPMKGGSPRVLHIATHGFFFPDPKTLSEEKRRALEGNAPVFMLSEHPMIRSGLLLAGAQQTWSGGRPPEKREDGILTAYEISQMNLSNTELVVLSACETGLGDIAGNEGVYGLQRAFKIAGAKYLIMSLWKVSDQSSRELMTAFYEQWLGKGFTIPEAFHKAQERMKRKYPDAPYHWAGFVLLE